MSQRAILPGAEPYYQEGSKVGILLLHGLTASPQSMRYLADRYVEAGLSVAMPRLTGHGTSPADLAQASARDWMADIGQALRWLQQHCTSLFVSGLSIGGTLSITIKIALSQRQLLSYRLIPLSKGFLKHFQESALSCGISFLEERSEG